MDAPSIDAWIGTHVKPDPVAELAARPDLVEQARRGRDAGLTWPQISEWLRLHGIDIPWRRIEAVLRRG